MFAYALPVLAGYVEPEQVEAFSFIGPFLIPAMNVNVGVRTAAALLDQFYEKRRLLIVSTPTARNLLYRLQLGMLQVSPCRRAQAGGRALTGRAWWFH